MSNDAKTLKTRIQVKSDTETNWKKSVLIREGGTKGDGRSFVPLLGELIVFLEDSTHPFSRLKIGDGVRNVIQLPFIDAGTIGGETIPVPESEVYMYNSISNFPATGEQNKLYVDLTTSTIYCYTGSRYSQLSHFSFQTTKQTVSYIVNWDDGAITSVSGSGGILSITVGRKPSLTHTDHQVINSIT